MAFTSNLEARRYKFTAYIVYYTKCFSVNLSDKVVVIDCCGSGYSKKGASGFAFRSGTDTRKVLMKASGIGSFKGCFYRPTPAEHSWVQVQTLL